MLKNMENPWCIWSDLIKSVGKTDATNTFRSDYISIVKDGDAKDQN
ncbi:hypothetical protein HYD59_01135 [Mycoplasmopsis bovis]|nr:hypothetical protein [Mycoplasmopsis bovis]QQH60900.1 hypothetical protein HYD59_01135 [Mycoplasmopsis bovis]